ncbi:hypothetical protein GF360_03615 [candidate division WWE3 bacterium]|nr:hypothetical protein [candidate division WWE3 bacterium]
MTKKAAYIKTLITASTIFVVSYFLTHSLINYFETQGYFALNFNLISGVGLLILGLTYAVSLSSPAWGEWSQFIIVPLPFILGVYLNLVTLEPANALVFSILIFLILSFFIEKSINLEQLLAKNIPVVFLRPGIKGLLLCISMVAATVVLLNPRDKAQELTETVQEAANSRVSKFFDNGIFTENPEVGALLEYTSLEQSLGEEITTQVKSAIEPYRHLINIFMAVFIFLAMQGFNAVVYLVYSISIGFLFWIARKTGFVKKKTELIEKEVLRF